MRILETGRPPVLLRPGMRFTCPACACVFELEAGDEALQGIWFGEWPVRCPRCKAIVTFGKPHCLSG